MEAGPWIAFAGVALAVGWNMAETRRKGRSERIEDLEAQVEKLTKAQARCEAQLRALMDWIRDNMPGLPPIFIDAGK